MSDSISRLPDSLLQHILSFLPTKDAIATSLLSKRWRPLWFSLSTLDVDDLSFSSSISFLQFVDAVLILGDLRPIKKFRLCCRATSIPPNQIRIWVNAAINRKVQQLELIFPFLACNNCLPSNIFVCSTIKELKLDGVTVDTLSYVNLPSLKIMHLQRVKFPDFKYVAMLLYGCPLLENLALSYLDIRNHISAANDIRSLLHLASAALPPFMMTSKAFSNVKFLRLCQNIWSPIQDMPAYYNLTRMEFSCFAKDSSRIVKCLHSCPKLQILVTHQVLVSSSNPDEEDRLMEPILDVPQCISSHLKKFNLLDYQDLKCQFQIVRYIMKKARVLRIVSIRSTCFSNLENKHQMLRRLSKCPRGSYCKLLFN